MKDHTGKTIGHKFIGPGKRTCPQARLQDKDCWSRYSWSERYDLCGYCGGLIRAEPPTPTPEQK